MAFLVAGPAMAEEGNAVPSPDGLRWNGPAPTLQLGGGDFTLRPTLRLDADAGSFFGQEEPGGYRSGVNLRRGRLGVRGTVLRDFSYAFTWEFGGASPNDYGNLFEAQVAYTGLRGTTIRAGAFTLQHLPDFAGSSFDLPFLERAAISNVVGSLASGSTRTAIGAEGNGAIGGEGARWNASAYVTGGVASTPHDERQRGLAGRAVLLAVDRPGLQVQFGLDAAVQLHPGTSPGPESIRLRDYPELRVDSRRFLDSGSIRADGAWAAGPEASVRLGPVYLEGVWQRVAVDAVSGPDARFEGWYVQALMPLVGPPRQRAAESGTWKRPEAGGFPGALELAGRYSTVDLRQGSRGARQSVLTLGLNWYPTDRLRLAAHYENGTTVLDGPGRDFQAVGLRAAFNL